MKVRKTLNETTINSPLPPVLPVGATVYVVPPEGDNPDVVTYDKNELEKISESKWKGYWRPAAAIVYLVIILMDFMVMPIVYEVTDHTTPQEIISLIVTIPDPSVQTTAINAFTSKRVWVPLTVQGGGLFHLAFGAILGISSWTRGQEKVAFAKRGKQLS